MTLYSNFFTCCTLKNRCCHVLSCLNEFSGVVLRCFMLSHQTSWKEVSLTQLEDTVGSILRHHQSRHKPHFQYGGSVFYTISSKPHLLLIVFYFQFLSNLKVKVKMHFRVCHDMSAGTEWIGMVFKWEYNPDDVMTCQLAQNELEWSLSENVIQMMSWHVSWHRMNWNGLLVRM